ncbi:F-box only protein 3 isoform X3 [Boleophthalmus pectinirostris]|uniref:F-box only protein 3 isoform X3 n=1 Tax=Boleophthalmus pectinirostris TaxID=150288 RepID=UPI00242FAE22|nr:F-box only protein 3 isoform X3 [Boleophthalmus pectinirostris]
MRGAAVNMAAVSSVSRLQDLPSDPLLHVLSYLSFRDLLSCSHVCRRLNDLSKHNPLWKRLCHQHWLLKESDRAQSALSWYDLFVQTYSDLGRYVDVYAELKHTWDQLTAFLQLKCPRIIASLKEGATESELDAVEAQIELKLPNDYRCSCRIHNGQKLVIPGLMGSMSLSNHYRSEVLLDVETAAGGFQTRPGMKLCLPLTFCFHTGLSQYLSLDHEEGRTRGEVFYPCPNQRASDPSAIDMFITGSSFSSWFSSYVQNVVSGEFPIIRDQIFRYVHEKGCVATTDDITVSVSTSFLPELSSVHPPHYFFTYRISEQRGGVPGGHPTLPHGVSPVQKTTDQTETRGRGGGGERLFSLVVAQHLTQQHTHRLSCSGGGGWWTLVDVGGRWWTLVDVGVEAPKEKAELFK